MLNRSAPVCVYLCACVSVCVCVCGPGSPNEPSIVLLVLSSLRTGVCAAFSL